MNPEAVERETYETIWASVEQYGAMSPGAQHVPTFLDIARPGPGAWVLDAGCGSGKGALALQAAGMRVTMTDITAEGLVDEARNLPFVDACLWRDVPVVMSGVRLFGGLYYDYVYCCDVLEHLPTAYTMLTVDKLLSVSKHGVFLSVGTTEDLFGFWVGRPLHQTVQSFTWWRDHLSGIATVAVARDLISSAIFYLKAR